eukprot:CAMPEP_0114266120 /NCGR_PEP_ID=MMETSP0058-20121206/24407_1 /TAXON_ID=36894 /ORGANISM="Pyramimonas parkeae, CCMP726" /LENGTH=122 /DNA_ID=CAMNT_0001383513 /DNA_START=278 /DNA_END=644 /DNA_ORIENTATION=-
MDDSSLYPFFLGGYRHADTTGLSSYCGGEGNSTLQAFGGQLPGTSAKLEDISLLGIRLGQATQDAAAEAFLKHQIHNKLAPYHEQKTTVDNIWAEDAMHETTQPYQTNTPGDVDGIDAADNW